jgi:hypothetical protein
MPAMIGEANEVPPAPAQLLGSPVHGAPPFRVSDQHIT